ncbi:MAG: DNA mismatch repair endonuclease MutL [Deltaproteobacteria bacterium]|jgi:DNA mismatch repair protein MutL|nr:DNA mismatch repair endonuclease MutL [Deltaproteobacteria bacterium]
MTSRIKLLPEHLINRIAAGEVVERPASVLKELLENSLDAGATRIDVDIEGGGKKLIRVADNGHGLNKEELFLCLERHATSKLSADSDLFDINTLGFRGEALPSIASVSKMTVTSQPENEPGHRLKVAGGKILDLSPAATNQGTVVEVRDLFYNVPARRKFLKTDATETAHLIEVTQRYALSRPNLRLRLRDGAREVIGVDEHNDTAARAMKILGREVAASLKLFRMEREDLKIEGYVTGPETSRTNQGLFVFVLGRPVRDKLLNKAIIQGYGRTLPHGRFPSGVIFIDLDPSKVDVNVHPAKTEVRFRDPGLIFDTLSKAVSGTIDVSPLAEKPYLGESDEITRSAQGIERPFPGETDPGHFSLGERPGRKLPAKGDKDEGRLSNERDGRDKGFYLPHFSMGRAPKGPKLDLAGPPPTPPWMVDESGPDSPHSPNANDTVTGVATGGNPETVADTVTGFAPETSPEAALASRSVQGSQSPLATNGVKAVAGYHDPTEGAIVVGQLHQSYILAQGPGVLYVIDQHAAHERILFNSLKNALRENGVPSQGLLLPQTVEMGPQESIAVERLLKPLRHLGFQIEPFGERVWSLRGIPNMMTPKEATDAFLEIIASAKKRLRDLDGAGLDKTVEELSDTWLYGLACRAAVKAGDRLSYKEMVSLIDSLAKLGSGGYCPHGRPSTLVFTIADFEKRFGRT